MEYELRLFSKDQAEAYAKLFDGQTIQVDAETRARRHWWCFDNPNGGAFAVILAGERVVSTCYLSGKHIKQGDGFQFCYEIGETATDSDHQRKGLFSKLVNAMTAHSGATGSANVYGTPNPQSAPGYSKLGFTNLPVENHAMLLLPNVTHWIFRRGKKPRLTDRTGKHEITAAAYIEQTTGFPRLNTSTAAYLRWRLSDAPRNYKYFRLESSDGAFHCAARKGTLGDLPVIVVAEHFFNGKKTTIGSLAPLLRKALHGAYAKVDFAGIYVLAETPKTFGRAAQVMKRAIFHRDFPVCVQRNENGAAHSFISADFQLSDCDIG